MQRKLKELHSPDFFIPGIFLESKLLFVLGYKKTDDKSSVFFFSCDLGRIQTFNLLSRNQVHYSVMLRGLFAGANIRGIV